METHKDSRKAPRVRSRAIHRYSKDGKRVFTLVYLPERWIPKVMNRDLLGEPFADFVRDVWTHRPEHPRTSELPRPLVPRGVLLPRDEVERIRRFEARGTSFDGYVGWRLKKKLGL
jgi:hypothetical protein